jgi:hypothetical protein
MLNEKPDDQQKASNRGLQAAVGLGYQLIAAMGIFGGGGFYLDTRRGGGHVYLLIGIGLAFMYGGYEVWKLVRWIESDNQPPSTTDQRP